MTQDLVRVAALAAIMRPGTEQFLVFAGHDATRRLDYHRPFGGGVEFGETAFATIRRELREELDVDVIPLRLLGASQSIFVSGGRQRHEIALIVEARFSDASLYDHDYFKDAEGNGEDGIWRTREDSVALFPDEFPSILQRSSLLDRG